MKKQIIQFRNIKRFSAALITSAILLTGANAQEGKDPEKTPTVNYIGVRDNMVAFNIKFTNTISDKFVLEMVDENGDLVYSRKFTEKNLNKNILVKNVGEDNQSKVTFIIRAGKSTYNYGFDINTIKKYENSMVVTRL